MALQPHQPQGCGISYLRCRVWSYECRSNESWRGIPLVHVAFGRWDGGRYRPARARGLIAVADTAVGVVAAGLIAAGGVAVGPHAFEKTKRHPTGPNHSLTRLELRHLHRKGAPSIRLDRDLDGFAGRDLVGPDG